MTEGGIANWKVKEGESFAPGDVLFEIVSGDSLSLFLPSPPSPNHALTSFVRSFAVFRCGVGILVGDG